MNDDQAEYEDDYPAAIAVASTWQATLFIGVITLILGIIVAVHPSGSLNVIAVLLGILLIVSGIFHLVRIFDRARRNRVWQGISGLLFIVVGVVLIRHLDLTVAAIGLLIGITWIVQGVAGLIAAFATPRGARGWWFLFALISLVAGIVVTAAPVKSVTALAILMGIWFIIMGVFEISLAFIIRHALSKARAQPGPWPPDEGAEARGPGRSA